MNPDDLVQSIVAEAAAKRSAMLNGLAEQFLKATGLNPTEVELVEKTEVGKIIWFFREKSGTCQACGRKSTCTCGEDDSDGPSLPHKSTCPKYGY